MKPVATIMLIEDDIDMLELEVYHLKKAGFKTFALTSTQLAEKVLSEESIDLIIMDRMLPHIEGTEFVAYLKDKGFDIPVLFVSAKNSDDDVIEGFQRGGDDYLRKPFDMRELVYRVKAILKRAHHIGLHYLTGRDITVNIDDRKVFVEDKEIKVTRLEFTLLTLFLKNKNKILTRDFLLKEVWKDDERTQKRTVNVTVKRLREKIDPDNRKDYIVAVRGIGYKFQA